MKNNRPIDIARRRKHAAGLIWEAFVARCGYSYHRTEQAAIRAARRRSNAAARAAGCPGNGPSWDIAPTLNHQPPATP